MRVFAHTNVFCVKNGGNPVKHGLVKEPGDWPYSTYHVWKKEFGRPINVPPENWKPVHLGEA